MLVRFSSVISLILCLMLMFSAAPVLAQDVDIGVENTVNLATPESFNETITTDTEEYAEIINTEDKKNEPLEINPTKGADSTDNIADPKQIDTIEDPVEIDHMANLDDVEESDTLAESESVGNSDEAVTEEPIEIPTENIEAGNEITNNSNETIVEEPIETPVEDAGEEFESNSDEVITDESVKTTKEAKVEKDSNPINNSDAVLTEEPIETPVNEEDVVESGNTSAKEEDNTPKIQTSITTPELKENTSAPEIFTNLRIKPETRVVLTLNPELIRLSSTIQGGENIAVEIYSDDILIGQIQNGVVTYAVEFVPGNVFVTISGLPGTEFDIVFTFENAEKNQISSEYAESNLAPQTENIMPELQPEVQAIEPITISVAPQSEIPILEVQPEVQEPDPSTESVALQSEVLVEPEIIELVPDLIPPPITEACRW